MTPIQAGVASTLIDVSFTVIACIARWTDTAITINQVLEKEKGGGEKHMQMFLCVHKHRMSVVLTWLLQFWSPADVATWHEPAVLNT